MAPSRRATLAAALTPLRDAIIAANNIPAAAGAPASAKAHYIYEFFVLMSYVNEIKGVATVTYDPGSGTTLNRFPRAPADKKNRPKFYVSRGGHQVAQICAGTAVIDQHGTKRHPDVSLQRASAGDHPGKLDVIAILDAKYSKNAEEISLPDFSHFARFVDLLVGAASIGLPPVTSIFQGNCLVTNGEFSTENDSELFSRNVREIRDLHPSLTPSARP